MYDLLVDNDAIDELGLPKALPLFLYDLDVLDICESLSVPLIDDLPDGVDGDFREVVPLHRDDLASHRCVGELHQCLVIVEVHIHGVLLQSL